RRADDRAAVGHQPGGAFACAVDDAEEVRGDDSLDLCVGQLADVRVPDADSGVEERRVELALERAPRGGVADVELREVERDHLPAVERGRDRTADAAPTSGNERSHGMSTTLPTLCRDSTSSWARSTSVSGISAPTTGFSA